MLIKNRGTWELTKRTKYCTYHAEVQEKSEKVYRLDYTQIDTLHTDYILLDDNQKKTSR